MLRDAREAGADSPVEMEADMAATPFPAPPFKVRDLGEVAIRCRDLAAMTAFYRDVIGLEVIEGDYSSAIVFLKVAEGFGGHTQVVALFGADGEDFRKLRHYVPQTRNLSALIDLVAKDPDRDVSQIHGAHS